MLICFYFYEIMLKFKFQILKLNSPVFEKCKNLLKLKFNTFKSFMKCN